MTDLMRKLRFVMEDAPALAKPTKDRHHFRSIFEWFDLFSRRGVSVDVEGNQVVLVVGLSEEGRDHSYVMQRIHLKSEDAAELARRLSDGAEQARWAKAGDGQ